MRAFLSTARQLREMRANVRHLHVPSLVVACGDGAIDLNAKINLLIRTPQRVATIRSETELHRLNSFGSPLPAHYSLARVGQHERMIPNVVLTTTKSFTCLPMCASGTNLGDLDGNEYRHTLRHVQIEAIACCRRFAFISVFSSFHAFHGNFVIYLLVMISRMHGVPPNKLINNFDGSKGSRTTIKHRAHDKRLKYRFVGTHVGTFICGHLRRLATSRMAPIASCVRTTSADDVLDTGAYILFYELRRRAHRQIEG